MATLANESKCDTFHGITSETPKTFYIKKQASQKGTGKKWKPCSIKQLETSERAGLESLEVIVYRYLSGPDSTRRYRNAENTVLRMMPSVTHTRKHQPLGRYDYMECTDASVQ